MPEPPHGRIGLAYDTARTAAQYVPGVGLVVERPHPQDAFMAEGLGISLQQAAQLDLAHPFVQDLGDFRVHFLRDRRGLFHERDLEGRFLFSHRLRHGRRVDELRSRKQVPVLHHHVVGHHVELQSDPFHPRHVRLYLLKGLERYHLFQGRFPPRPLQLPSDKEHGVAFEGHKEEGVLHGAGEIIVIDLIMEKSRIETALFHEWS